jgi:hypothetical protein
VTVKLVFLDHLHILEFRKIGEKDRGFLESPRKDLWVFWVLWQVKAVSKKPRYGTVLSLPFRISENEGIFRRLVRLVRDELLSMLVTELRGCRSLKNMSRALLNLVSFNSHITSFARYFCRHYAK